MRPRTQYASVGDAEVAYQVFGDGPIDLVLILGMASAIDVQWDYPPWVGVVERLASFARVIQFDRRGTGGSDALQFTREIRHRTTPASAARWRDSGACACST